jgi:transporter family-2 protein
MKLFYLFSALLIGISLIVQASVNAQLRKSLESPVNAAIISFVVGTVALVIYAIFIRQAPPTFSQFASLKWWQWVGGLIGACYVIGVILLVPKLGTLGLFSALIAGQMIASLVIDHYGWFGMTQKPIDWQRMVGAMMLIGAMYLIQKK